VTTTDLEADRALLRSAIGAAGELALAHFKDERWHWYKGPGQVLTQADLDVDRLLRERILATRPDDGWLSEESPDDGSRHRRRRVWVVDPIDGTRAFADRIPEFAISIGLLIDAEPVLGVVLNPATGERFEATRGGGAWQGGRRLAVSNHAAIEGARLLSSRTEMKHRRWPELFAEAHFTTMGSLAYKLALIACGRFDGLVSLRWTHDWDVAAAHLLLDEAGGRLFAADGAAITYHREDPRHRGLVAGPPALHAKLCARLAQLAREPADHPRAERPPS